jgi:signal transduction histidine kinase
MTVGVATRRRHGTGTGTERRAITVLARISARLAGATIGRMRTLASERGTGWLLRAVLICGALAIGAAMVEVQVRSTVRLTTYGSVSPTAMALDIAAGGLLLVGGAATWWSWREPRAGMLAVAAGLCWFGPDLLGRPELSPPVRAFGRVIAPMALPFLVGAVVLMTRNEAGLRTRLALAVLIVVTAVISLGRALTYEPVADPGCWASCLSNAFLVVRSDATSAALRDVGLLLTLGTGLGLAAWAIAQLAHTSQRARTWDGWVLVPAVAVGITAAASTIALLMRYPERPTDPVFQALFLGCALAVAALGAGIIWLVAAAVARTAAVRRLAADIGQADVPDALTTTLGRALGDRQVSVAYWLPEVARYVDGDGREVEPPTRSSSRAVATIKRGGERIAVIGYDPSVANPDLERAIGTAARLAVDNERLRAAVLWQLGELQASRARIVIAGDAERRRLERNLHDGVQQRLLALASDLALLGLEAERAGAAELATRMHQADQVADQALDDLRELAHGIYPAILGEAGLQPALATIARDAPLPVELSGDTGGRCAAEVETAAYHMVVEAINMARRTGATYAEVHLDRAAGRLSVETRDDGRGPLGSLTHIRDRVGAVGGRLVTSEGAGDVRWIRAELPCAS